ATFTDIGPLNRLSNQICPPSPPGQTLTPTVLHPSLSVCSRHSLPPDCAETNGVRSEVSKDSWLSSEAEHMTTAVDGPPGTPRRSLDSNDPLTGCDWYVGEMDRAEAVSLLSNCENGTFLVRVSKSAERLGEYSLSIVYAYPRHIRIQRFPLSDGSTMAYGLCELEQFPTIPSMIDHYSKVSLNRCFDEVDTTLLYPYQRCPSSPLFFVRANFDFHNNSNVRLLNLKRDDRVAVLSVAREDGGWWKGWLNGRVGFFPMSFVTRELVAN
ncbi:Guanine nucleotide exchange factor VAV2, partial [Fasciolopsis buskii]